MALENTIQNIVEHKKIKCDSNAKLHEKITAIMNQTDCDFLADKIGNQYIQMDKIFQVAMSSRNPVSHGSRPFVASLVLVEHTLNIVCSDILFLIRLTYESWHLRQRPVSERQPKWIHRLSRCYVCSGYPPRTKGTAKIKGHVEPWRLNEYHFCCVIRRHMHQKRRMIPISIIQRQTIATMIWQCLFVPFHAPFMPLSRDPSVPRLVSLSYRQPEPALLWTERQTKDASIFTFRPYWKGPSPSGSWCGSYNRYRGGCQRRPQSRRGTLRVSHTRRRWPQLSNRTLRRCTPSPRPWLWGGIALFIRLDFRTSKMACWWSIPFVDFQDDPGTIVLGFSDGSNALLLTPNAIFEGAMRSWMRPSGLCFMGRRLI